MKIDANKIEIFKNLAEFNLEGIYYDFHNDFECIKIEYVENELSVLFKNNLSNDKVVLRFENVNLIKRENVKFINSQEEQKLTIDTLYKGRYEKSGSLIEFDKNGKSFFYLEFYEGEKLEFWCEKLVVEEV